MPWMPGYSAPLLLLGLLPLAAHAYVLSFGLPFGAEEAGLPACTHAWDGVAFVDSPIDILPLGDKLVPALTLDCFNVTVEANDAFCRTRFELLLTNGEQHILNPLLECTAELPCREVRLNPIMGLIAPTNFSAPRPTKWVLRYTNEGGTREDRSCSEQKVRIALSVLGNPQDRLCPVVGDRDCGGHGWCSVNAGHCICHEHEALGFWNCTPLEDAPDTPAHCSCAECLRPWAGDHCTIWMGPSSRLPVWAWMLVFAVLAISGLLVTSMVLTLRRYRRIINEREEYAPIVETATQSFRVEHINAPSVRTKLYF